MAGQRNQINLVQGFVAAHLPLLTAGGVDVKLGLFVSPQGRESLDASGNPFYSHSYIDNYGTTFNHTGVLTTTHVNAALDVYLGIDTGNQTTFGATFSRQPLRRLRGSERRAGRLRRFRGSTTCSTTS